MSLELVVFEKATNAELAIAARYAGLDELLSDWYSVSDKISNRTRNTIIGLLRAFGYKSIDIDPKNRITKSGVMVPYGQCLPSKEGVSSAESSNSILFRILDKVRRSDVTITKEGDLAVMLATKDRSHVRAFSLSAGRGEVTLTVLYVDGKDLSVYSSYVRPAYGALRDSALSTLIDRKRLNKLLKEVQQ